MRANTLPTMLLLPGFACSAKIWDPLVSRLAGSGAVTAVDYPTALTPRFHSVDLFADWLWEEIRGRRFDVLAGHSLGGLVALRLVQRHPTAARRLVLIESFLQPPGSFFRNLLLPGAPPTLVSQVTHMLRENQPHYSPGLQQALRESSQWDGALPRDVPVTAVYGDRGRPEAALQSLAWPANLSARVDVRLIPNACHFPMLENASATAAALQSILLPGQKPVRSFTPPADPS